jgi:adenylylsulfate kinase
MNGAVVWLTGLPASGKSTLAGKVVENLRETGREPLLLDGDDVRDALVPRPGYDDFARESFYRTLAALASLAARQGLIVVVAATTHRRAWRDAARASAPRFVEVHVATAIDECRRRDPKGLYGREDARRALPGAGVTYEPPEHPEVVVRPGAEPHALAAILARLEIGGLRR